MNGLERMLAPLRRAVANLLARGVVVMSDSSKKMQALQIRLLDGDEADGVEHFEAYGLTARPRSGAECVALSLCGGRSHMLAIAVADRRYRLTGLQEGEVALYDDQGQKVHLTRNGIVISTTKKCRIEAQDIELHASNSYSWDVAGYGERFTWLSGTTWEHKTWKTGATVNSVSLPIHPPEGP